ncbi:tectonic-3-like [Amphiura filiformis]|uniref:tectonic-3-like n=1 Tax=Amphiura filiformis TaxID=82378 RepID=UPI003B21BA79
MASASRGRLLSFVLLFLFTWPSSQQGTDTLTTDNSVVTDPPLTNAPTDPPVVVTSQAPLPTTAVPTDATELPENTDLGPCICDLTINGCDVNCCCDPDCTTDDRNTFSECIEDTNVVDERLCIQSDIIFLENTPETVDTSNPSLFCIVTDNFEERNYYTIPQTVETVERFEELTDQYGDTSYAAPPYQNETYADFYKSGDAIYTIYESLSLGVVGLPAPLHTSECEDGNPASYLYNEGTECVRRISNLQDQCQGDPALSALSYYTGFKIVTTPSFLQDFSPPDPRLVNMTETPTVRPTPTTDPNATNIPIPTTFSDNDSLYDSLELLEITVREPVLCESTLGVHIPCNFDGGNVPIPDYNSTSGICEYILKEVNYYITHNGTNGITDAEVQLVLGSHSMDGLSLTQFFSTSFIKFDEVDVFERSGNPGYVIGEPLMAGNLVQLAEPDGIIKKSIELGNDRNNWLTIVKGTADGTCVTDADSRTPVTFGEDVRSGCTIRVSYENVSNICEFIQASALNALTGQMPEYVAMFGNSAVEVVGDWVPIIVDDLLGLPSSPSSGTCINMVMALHIEVLYANVGSLANPQAKVIGVRYNYAEGKILKYHCSGAYCQVGADSLTQSFEVASSVGFVETSDYPEAVLAERPSFDSKLPNDFFYPFTFGSSTRLQLDVRLLYVLICCYVVVYVQSWDIRL